MIRKGERVVVDGKHRGKVERLGIYAYLIYLDGKEEASWYHESRVERDGQMEMRA